MPDQPAHLASARLPGGPVRLWWTRKRWAYNGGLEWYLFLAIFCSCVFYRRLLRVSCYLVKLYSQIKPLNNVYYFWAINYLLTYLSPVVYSAYMLCSTSVLGENTAVDWFHRSWHWLVLILLSKLMKVYLHWRFLIWNFI